MVNLDINLNVNSYLKGQQFLKYLDDKFKGSLQILILDFKPKYQFNDMCSINEWGVTKMLNVFIPSQCFVINSIECVSQMIFEEKILFQYVFVTSKTFIDFNCTFLLLGQKAKFMRFYDPQIETINCIAVE